MGDPLAGPLGQRGRAPYACGTSSSCATTCDSDVQCAASGWCDTASHACKKKFPLGSACFAKGQCASGFCVEGVCCTTSCDGICQACAAKNKASGVENGECELAKDGADPHDDCMDDGAASCLHDGLCDGKGACRDYPLGSPCGATSCENNVQTGHACNGSGACLPDLIVDCGAYLCAGGVWAGALRAGGLTMRAATLARLGVVKLFIDQALPSAGLGGTAAVVRSLMRRGVGRPVAIAAMFVDLITHYAAFAALFAVAMLVLFLHHDLSPAVLSLSALFALAALGIPSAAVALHRGKPRWLVRAAGRFRWSRSFLASLEEASHPVLRSPRALAQAFALNASVFLLDTATLHILLTAVGVSAHASTSLAAFMLASAAGTLTILPGGLGTFEGVAVAVLNVLGVPLEAALLATLLFRGLSFWLPMVPGIFLTRGVIAS